MAQTTPTLSRRVATVPATSTGSIERSASAEHSSVSSRLEGGSLLRLSCPPPAHTYPEICVSDDRVIRSWEVDKDLARPVRDARTGHSEKIGREELHGICRKGICTCWKSSTFYLGDCLIATGNFSSQNEKKDGSVVPGAREASARKHCATLVDRP